ncbi:MAG TPA: vitamin K epoxide reductase family protein [Acidimicrobiales bacterium]|nr:vitamin K epoxide reductase family protein [Acidimicrobiales bacterium]
MSRAARPVAAWVPPTTWVLSLAGLAISSYLTFTHFAGSQYLACSDSGVVNCGVVTTSAQSYFLGVPVAVLGLVNYLVLSVLNSPWAWRWRSYWTHVARLVLVVGSMAFVLWLVAAELLIIDHICLWCTGVHVVTFALFAVMVYVAPRQLLSDAGEFAAPSR